VVVSRDRPVRIAYLSYSSGLFDARSFRMAAWAASRGHQVTIYARWEPGLPVTEDHDGYRIVRAPWTPRSLLPGGWKAGRRAPRASAGTDAPAAPKAPKAPAPPTSFFRSPRRTTLRWLRLLSKFPIRPIAWARAVDAVAEPADLWHGMWAGSLPAIHRLRRRHGGRTIYDSRDMYMDSRNLASAPRLIRAFQGWLERRWARAADRVITVNRPYAERLGRRFGIAEPAIVMNCPVAWTPPDPLPDLLRSAAGIDPATRVVLYQGQLISDRGIEQAMDAILQVPNAALVLLGYGDLTEHYRALAARPPYAGHVHLLPAVHPDELIAWTASADVMLMPIQPTTLNHQYTTPQKLFESIAAGVPVVASDMPGMRAIVEELDAGVLCDPTDPALIAASLRTVLDAPAAERAARRERILRAAREQYSWEVQVEALRAIYDHLVAPTEAPRRA
jgi:glycosyltransferase involved in cell wall biosynthesis